MKARGGVLSVPALGLLLLLLGGASALAQTLRVIPVPPGVKPRWQEVPGVPQVAFAPNLPTDVFRYRGRYYLYWDGMWFASRTLQGPWERPRSVPPALGRIPSSYFKTAGRRTGPPEAGREPSGAFQPPVPPGAGKRDPFSVPGVAPPPGWQPPSGSGQPGGAPPGQVTAPGMAPVPPPTPPVQEGPRTGLPKAM